MTFCAWVELKHVKRAGEKAVIIRPPTPHPPERQGSWEVGGMQLWFGEGEGSPSVREKPPEELIKQGTHARGPIQTGGVPVLEEIRD